MEHEELLSAPIINLDEQKRRGKRSEHNYLVICPGQSQDQGEWFSKGQLKASFPPSWRYILDSWKQQKAARGGGNGAAGGSGEEETTTLGGSVQEGGGNGHPAAANIAAAGEHQASVIGGEFHDPGYYEYPHLEQQVYQHVQHQQQQQQMPERFPSLSPRLLPEPEVPVGFRGRGATKIAGQLPRVQLYQQKPAEQQIVELRPLRSGDQGVFIPAAAAAISPNGRVEWRVEQQQPKVNATANIARAPLQIATAPRLSSRVADLFNGRAEKKHERFNLRDRDRNAKSNPVARRIINSAPGPSSITAPAAAAAAPFNGVGVHPLLRKNLEYAHKHQENGKQQQQQQQQRQRPAVRKAADAAEEATAAAAPEFLKVPPSKTTLDAIEEVQEEEVEERRGKRRRRVLQGPSREPKTKRGKNGEVTPLPITRAAAVAAAAAHDTSDPDADAEEIEVADPEGEDVEIVEDEPMMPEQAHPETVILPDTEDDDDEEEIVEVEEKNVVIEEDLADFEKESNLDEKEKERRRTIRLRLQPESWAQARITGAKHTGEHVLLYLCWSDGFKESCPTPWLRETKFIHCMNTLIDFYESKTKKKGVKAATADGAKADAKAGGGGGGTGISDESTKERSEKGASGGGDDGSVGVRTRRQRSRRNKVEK